MPPAPAPVDRWLLVTSFLILQLLAGSMRSPAQVIVEYPLPKNRSLPWAIAVGPDGNIWFTEAVGNRIGRITPAGVITEFPIPTGSSVSEDITAGPDGNLWFTESAGNSIGRITTNGVITEFAIPTLNARAEGIGA